MPNATFRMFAFLCLAAGSSPASMAAPFAFDYYGAGVAGSGILQVTSNFDGSYLVTGISGQRNAASVTGLEPTPVNVSGGYSQFFVNGVDTSGGYFLYDNTIFPGQTPQVDFGGLLFDVPGAIRANLYSNAGVDYELTQNGFINTQVTLTIAPAVLFPFQYSGPGVSASGVLYTLDQHDGSYLVTWIDGERNGAPITGIQPTHTNESGGFSYYFANGVDTSGSYFYYDNLIFPGQSSQVDLGGLLFDVAGVPVANLYSDAGSYFDLPQNTFANTLVQFSTVPEPDSLALLACGLSFLLFAISSPSIRRVCLRRPRGHRTPAAS